jgi:hypothetical protein
MENDSAILYLFRKNRPKGEYPAHISNHVKKIGPTLGKAVYAKWDTLRAIVFNKGELVRSRWEKKKLGDRQDLLKAAWSGIPEFHRPESFAQTYKPYRPAAGVPPMDHMCPYINLKDLENKAALLRFIDARAGEAPDLFAMSEHIFMPAVQIEIDNKQPSKMWLRGRKEYGKVKDFGNADEANQVEYDAKGVNSCKGLLILFIQERILDFLVFCCQNLLADKEMLELLPPSSDSKLGDSWLASFKQDRTTDHAVVAASAPFLPRTGLDLDRIRHLVSTQTTMAELDVWQIREDPAHFASGYAAVADHDPRFVLDPLGREDASTKTQAFISSNLNILVTRSHYELVCWDQIRMQLEKIERLLVKHPDGLNIDSLQPLELGKAVQFFGVLLDNATGVFMHDIGNYSASFELRRFFTRTSTIDRRASLHEDPVRSQVCKLIEDLKEHQKKKQPGSFTGVRFRLDLIDTYLREKPAGWKWISPLVQQALTKLSILAECSFVFEFQPWHEKLQWNLLEERLADEKYVDSLWGPQMAWITILEKGQKGDFAPDPSLGDPSDGKFDYPVQQGKNKKKVVEQMCRAEANLDTLWGSIDAKLKELADGHAQVALQRLLDQGGDMRRTKSWSERHQEWSEKYKSETPARLPSDLLCEPQALSRIFHDASKDITGNFDKSTISIKTEEKTRGEPAPDEAAAELARDPSPERRPTLKVSKKAFQTFSKIFHDPDANGTAAGPVQWRDFKTALTSLGFTAAQMHGSQWQFNPSPQMELARGISFHQPHPETTFSRDQARNIGTRLHRVYGWDASTFERQ